MSRCRRTDTIADIVADPALGVDALSEEQWAHVGVCADCHATVRALDRLDRAIATALRSQPHEDLPAAVVATPALPRRSEGTSFGTLLAVAAVVVLAIGIATFGGQWLAQRGLGIGLDPSPSPGGPSPSLSPADPTDGATPSATPLPTTEPSAAPMPDESASLAIGAIAAVVDEPLVVRTAPGTDPESTITPDRLWVGQRVRILDGPADVDGYTWWEVQVGEIRGWVADGEADDSAPWLAPIANGRIWFWRHPGEGAVGSTPELFSIRSDASDEVRIGSPTASAMRLVISCGFLAGALEWRHDGRWATFGHSEGGCDGEVYVLDASTGEARRLGGGHSPTWRPDGTHVTFGPNTPYLEMPELGEGEILIAELDGGIGARLTDTGVPVFAGFPSWSPDRRAIAYSGAVPSDDGLPDSTFNVYVADADGSNVRTIAEGARPTWSPDGRWIVAERPTDDGMSTELWRMRPDGSDAELLGEGWLAEFSPDGSRLAFVRDGGVWTMGADGSDASGAIPATTVDGIGWSPDGSSLIVASDHGSDGVGISIVSLGAAAPAITGVVTPGHAPSWQPMILDTSPTD